MNEEFPPQPGATVHHLTGFEVTCLIVFAAAVVAILTLVFG